ncbi:MAG: CesT family type III secretion system chaperone [Kluyvera sp.]|uniref:CesT family type III secretion system chaperone n=1 Tax=Kluyvera sp. TaxID=1538228 RepID=UPI003F39D8F9
MDNNELLKNFGNDIGVKNLRLDSQRSCQLNIDNKYLVLINEIDDENLLLNGVIGNLSAEAVEKSATVLLSMNMLFANIDGPYVTWEPKHQILLISKPLNTPETDVIAVHEQIKHLLQNVHHIKESLFQEGIEFTPAEF